MVDVTKCTFSSSKLVKKLPPSLLPSQNVPYHPCNFSPPLLWVPFVSKKVGDVLCTMPASPLLFTYSAKLWLKKWCKLSLKNTKAKIEHQLITKIWCYVKISLVSWDLQTRWHNQDLRAFQTTNRSGASLTSEEGGCSIKQMSQERRSASWDPPSAMP